MSCKKGWLSPGWAANTLAVLKIVKLLIGILLLPLCVGAAAAVWRVLRASGNADSVWVPLMGGGLCWAVIYLLLPRPMWLYVAGHELTHAVWAWVFGGRVRKIKVTSKGGHVEVSKTNFLIALAPYFFPFYAALVTVVFIPLRFILGWAHLKVWFLLLLGMAYGFHVTLTGHILKMRQSDVVSHGYVFSGVIIFLGNILVLLVAVPLLTGSPALFKALWWWLEETWNLLQWVFGG